MCAHRPTVSERLVSPADWLEATGAGPRRQSPGVRGHTGFIQWVTGLGGTLRKKEEKKIP